MRISVLVLASLLCAGSAFAVDAEHSFQSVVPRGAVQRVLIDIPAGSFTVRNGAADRLALSGVASRDYDGARERAWAQQVVDDTSVEFYVNGSEAIVRRRFGRNAQGWRAKKFTGLDLRIDLPPGVDVAFTTSAGEVDLAGRFGNVDVDLRAGEIDLRLPRASVRDLSASCRIGEVHTNIGSELVSHEGILPGKARWHNAGGTSRVNAHTTVGEVRVTLTQ
ncbi:MAG TPA: hypothetical protein VF824_02390 [Thermoanaerobaculia bacterium]|jgi:hypothetical protein